MATSSSATAFAVATVCGKARLGVWNGMATPLALLPTHQGQPHHMLREPLHSLSTDLTPMAAVRYPHFWGQEAVITRSGKSLAVCCNLQSRQTIITLRDPDYATTTKWEASDDGVTVQTYVGRRDVTADAYMAHCAAMRPDAIVLANDEVPCAAGNNRSRTSAERGVRWLKRAAQVVIDAPATPALTAAWHPSEEVGPHSKSRRIDESIPPRRTPRLVAYVPAMRDAVARGKAVAATVAVVDEINAGWSGDADALIPGYVIGGLGWGEDVETRTSLLSAVVASLPPSAFRMVTGLATPREFLTAIELGVDVIDSNLAISLTEAGQAAAFLYDVPCSTDTVTTGATIATTSDATAASTEAPSGLHPMTLLLKDTGYAEDVSPLVPGCTCFACAGVDEKSLLPSHAGMAAGPTPRPYVRPTHTRAYINHLLNAKEMLGNVLLQAHNTHHVSLFLEAIRRHIRNGTFPAYKAAFEAAHAA